VAQRCAWSKTAIEPPANASSDAGKVNGKMQPFIRRRRDFDFSIEEIRSLLSLVHGRRSCTEARKLAEGRLVGLRRKLVELQRLEKSIAALVRECESSCDGGAAPDCVILQTH
jgi:MerR family transcriptional regulator, copper efflux regulator